MHQILLLIVSFFMFVTGAVAMSKNSEPDNKNLKGYYIFAIVLGVLGFMLSFVGGKSSSNFNSLN
jgi:uncharacterized membrane protein YiaA